MSKQIETAASRRAMSKAPKGWRAVLPVRTAVLLIIFGLMGFFLLHAAWFHSYFERIESASPAIVSPSIIAIDVISVSVTPANAVIDDCISSVQMMPSIRQESAPQILSAIPPPLPPPKVAVQLPRQMEGVAPAIRKPVHLPGAGDHRILQLSDEELRSTPISTMMSWYGEANGGGSCAGDFGNQLVKRWRSTKSSYCKPTDTPSDLHSSIDCYLVHQTRHHGTGDNLCHMKNVAVDLQLFRDPSKTTPVIEEYVRTRHLKQPYVPFPRGFVQGDCQPDRDKWQTQNMPGWNVDWTVKAFEHITASSEESCALWIDHPVLITQRDTFANFFHDSEDFVNVFLALAILEWAPGSTQHFLTDLYPEGPFWDMWKTVYTHDASKPALTAWDIGQQYGRTDGKRVCFRDLAVGIYGPAAPITVASWDTPCSRTALVRAYADFVIRSLGLQGDTHYAEEKPSSIVRVTYMARRASTEWPEKRFCNDTHSFFACKYWEKFGTRALGRMIRNDAEVVAALKSLEQEFTSSPRVVFLDVDYNKMSFREQIRTDLQTDIMIGPHGAGLMHSIFMRDRAELIELSVDGSGVNRHFHNLALWAGKRYSNPYAQNPVNPQDLLNGVRKAIRRVALDKY